MNTKTKKNIATGAYLFIAALWALAIGAVLDFWLGGGTAVLAMTALAADRITEKKVIGELAYPIAASTKIWAGSIVALNTSGYAVPAADTAGLNVVGVAKNTVDNSAGANGDLKVNVEEPIIARFAATSITQAMVGKPMYVVDDQTFDDAPGTNGVLAGILVDFISTTEGRILIARSMLALALQGSVGGLVVASGTLTPDAADDTIATGLSTVLHAVAQLKDAPTLNHMFVSADVGDQAGSPAAGSIILHNRKPTGAADVTPVNATASWVAVDWVAIGRK